MKDKIDQSWFEDEESYESFLYAVQSAEKLIELSKKEPVQLVCPDGESWDTTRVRVVLDGCDSEVLFDCISVAGSTHNEDGLIYMELEYTKQYLSEWKVYKKESLNWMS